MNTESRLALSYYNIIADINRDHQVYLVRDSRDGRIYVRKDLAVYKLSVYRQLREHPTKGLSLIHELVESDGMLHVIEEYIQGDTLQDKLDRGELYAPEDACFIMLVLCDIVAELHNFQPPIIHRDIKPSNVIVADDGAIKLLDLNAANSYDATASTDTTLIGTQGYAAPEQYGFGASSVTTDIYAMGVLMNALMTGRVSNVDIPNGKYRNVIEKCVQLNPADRFASVQELKNALLQADEEPAAVKKTSAKKGSARKKYEEDPELEERVNLFGHSVRRAVLPPGFRRGKVSHMIIGALGYLFVFYIANVFDASDMSFATGLSYRICILVALLALILFNHNYLGIQNRVGFKKSWPWYVRIALLAVADVALFFVIVVIFAIFMAMLGLV